MMTFEVNDMTCGHCASTQSRALKALDRNAQVRIDLSKHRLQIAPTEADAQEIANAIKKAGYTPVSI